MTISRMALDPRDARRVFVAAVGHPFGPNPERGLFFSPDAGHSWQKILYIDEHHGASDLDIVPTNPDVLFAGMWKFERKPWRYDSGDTEGGLFRSNNGGKSWNKLSRLNRGGRPIRAKGIVTLTSDGRAGAQNG